jgi:hypothetical protein
MRTALLLICLAACSAPGSTRIELQVDYDESWGLTALAVSGTDQAGSIAPAHVLTLLVDEDQAGQPLLLTVSGTMGEVIMARGQVTVTPVLGQSVSAEVALEMTEACQPGDSCNEPHPAVCVDGDTLRSFAPGVCEAGSCSYAPTDTACSEGCASGACLGSVTPPAPRTFASGLAHVCTLSAAGTISCQGDRNSEGQLDAPSGTFTTLDAGCLHSCAVATDGTLACWGDDRYGQNRPPPGTFIAVTSGCNHSCALRTDGQPLCWGHNAHGQSAAPPAQLVAIDAGTSTTCGLRSDHTILCWGQPLMNGPPAGAFAQLALGNVSACAMDQAGRVQCWGTSPTPSLEVPPGTYVEIDGMEQHYCGLRADMVPVCWGGTGGSGENDVVPGAYQHVAAGYTHGCGQTSAGQAVCWGSLVLP